MKYLLYKDYESGVSNNWISLELGVGLARLTGRVLVFYGNNSTERGILHARGGNYRVSRSDFAGVVDNSWHPTILDLLDRIPGRTLACNELSGALQGLSVADSEARLPESVFLPKQHPRAVSADRLVEFAAGRTIIEDPAEDVWHLHRSNLAYYSRFFALEDAEFCEFLAGVRPAAEYRDLAALVSAALGKFSGIHVRLTDFRQFLPQDGSYADTIAATVRAHVDPGERLVICTDESHNREFFSPLLRLYPEHVFLDEFVVANFGKEFSELSFRDEQVLGFVCNLVMRNAREFLGTPGSTFSGLIHRQWARGRVQAGEPKVPAFRFVSSGDCGGGATMPGYFDCGTYVEVSDGPFSWNRIRIPRASETLSWYREWPESVGQPISRRG